MREKLRVHQTRVRHIDPTVLIENEEDLGDFPPEQTYTFIKETSYDVLSEKEQKIIKGNLFTMIWHIMNFINFGWLLTIVLKMTLKHKWKFTNASKILSVETVRLFFT